MIYLDYASTTPVREEVSNIMQKYLEDQFGNPTSLHSIGLQAKEVLEISRDKISKIINANSDEIIFTSSGTESINLAIKGIARANKNHGKHIITSKVEHTAVLETCKYLEENENFEITYLDVDQFGMVSPLDLKQAIRADTILISIMYANNEIGTIMPIKNLVKVAKEEASLKQANIYFHTDACQAGYLNIDVNYLGVDLMTLNSSKIYGPKGVGMLFVKGGINIHPIIHGGGQEFAMRSGTQNMAGIIGFSEALFLAQLEKEEENKRLQLLRDNLYQGIKNNIPQIFLNGHHSERLSNTLNISILDVDSETVVSYLNEAGICVSSGSACKSDSLEPSHVILAMGHPSKVAHSTLRFTLGRSNTSKDVNKVVEVLPQIVKALRMSSEKLTIQEVMN